MRLYVLISCLFLCQVAFSAEIKEQVIRHNSIQQHLLASDQSALEELLFSRPDCLIEKINIQTFSLDFVDKTQNQLLSEDRLDYIYSFLTELIEDDNNIELLNLNRNSIVPLDYRSYTLIKVYFVKKGNEIPIPGIERVLFPEEFNQEMESYIPKKFKKNTSFNIEEIHFYGNSAIYTDESKKSLEQLYRFLRDNPEVSIQIEGHVNGKLTKAYLREAAESNPEKKAYESSRHLSLERAKSVKNYLTEKGIKFSRIETVGKGSEDMIYKKPKNRKQEDANRRIEVIVVKS